MEDQLISFETAVLAREKGFNVPCRGRIHCSHYHFVKNNIIPANVPIADNEMFAPKCDWNNLEECDPNRSNSTLKGLYTSIPTQSLLQKWLREKYKIHIYVQPTLSFDKWTLNHNFYQTYNTYEETLEAGLIEALKLIKL